MSLADVVRRYRQFNDDAAERLGHDERPARIARAREAALEELRRAALLRTEPAEKTCAVLLDAALRLVEAEQP